jgi:hypothetical protein
MNETTHSNARSSLADLHDEALAHSPTRIIRRRAEPAILVSEEDFRTLLSRFGFSPEVLFEPSSVAIWLPELAIWGRGPTFVEAKDDLLEEVDQLLALLDRDARLRTSDAMVERLPWLYRLMDADSDEAREGILFAEPAPASKPAPGGI